MYSINEVNEIASNKEMSQNEDKDLIYILEVEIDTATDSITIAGIKTLLKTVFITLQDKRESIYSKLSG